MLDWTVKMYRENKKRKKDIGSKVIGDFEDFSDLSFKDVASFPDGRDEMIIQNNHEEGRIVTCRKIGQGKYKKVRKNIYLQENGLKPFYSRDFGFNGESSNFEKGQYAYWDRVLSSSYCNS